jgi:hypothetical protein
MSESISGGDMAGARGSGMVTLPAYLLEDSPRLAKRLEDLRAAEERAKEAIALIGDASQIEQLRAQAAAERDEQDRLTAETRKECEELLAFAKREATDIVDRARETAEGLLLRAQETEARSQQTTADASKVIAQAAETHADLQGREVSLMAEREALNKLQLDLHEREQLLLDEKSKLATVRERIAEILG